MTRPLRSLDVPGLAHKAPIPVGARVGNLICTSAIAGKDARSGELPPDATAQAALAFHNLQCVLDAGGASLGDVLKLTVYVKDDSVRDAINGEWLRRFPDPRDRPARHIVVHDLQHGMLLQLECLAVVASDTQG
ncbi:MULTISPECIES: RidA family protein [unclassified Cupriavidus]|uniref:RidA family protein n=1 Tax=unclassified Cupriavidus TaxID=2640874 RepID=UPI0004259EC7|nr:MULTISPECIES: RidA family protein [unclassified Cupriavidus]MBP0629085.1 RidA family protein [Cupriavidus sp. AcVe19-1a]